MHEAGYLIQHYGVFVVFLTVLIEWAGAPLPSYPLLVVAGALSLSGEAPVAEIIGAGVAGALLADLAWYGAGARFGRRILSLICRFTLSPDSCVQRTEDTFARLGPWSLLFAKFVPGLGYVSVALSGITGLSLLCSFFWLELETVSSSRCLSYSGAFFTMPSARSCLSSFNLAKRVPSSSLVCFSSILVRAGSSGRRSRAGFAWTASPSTNSRR
jgi:membrane protein DedA with SNARE-associated domain